MPENPSRMKTPLPTGLTALAPLPGIGLRVERVVPSLVSRMLNQGSEPSIPPGECHFFLLPA